MSNQSGVYIKDKVYGWLPGSVISYEDNNTKVKVSVCLHPDENANQDESLATIRKEERTVKLKDYDEAMLPLQNIDEGGSLIVVPDMCDLPSLHEVSTLQEEDLFSTCGLSACLRRWNPISIHFCILSMLI